MNDIALTQHCSHDSPGKVQPAADTASEREPVISWAWAHLLFPSQPELPVRGWEYLFTTHVYIAPSISQETIHDSQDNIHNISIYIDSRRQQVKSIQTSARHHSLPTGLPTSIQYVCQNYRHL